MTDQSNEPMDETIEPQIDAVEAVEVAEVMAAADTSHAVDASDLAHAGAAGEVIDAEEVIQPVTVVKLFFLLRETIVITALIRRPSGPTHERFRGARAARVVGGR